MNLAQAMEMFTSGTQLKFSLEFYTYIYIQFNQNIECLCLPHLHHSNTRIKLIIPHTNHVQKQYY